MHSYNVCGLQVASEVRLPGLVPSWFRGPSDVTIRRTNLSSTLDPESEKGPTWEYLENRFLLCVPGIAHFLIEDGNAITFETQLGADVADVSAFLTGSVFGILLHQRKQIILHASAVLIGEKAVIFCGESGAGKSTLAGALWQRGYPLISDDLSVLSLLENGSVHVYSDGRRLKLWSQAIVALSLQEWQGAPVRQALRKFYLTPDGCTGSPVEVGAVYTLMEARPPLQTGIWPANFVAAAQIALRSAYRPRLVGKMGQSAMYLAAGAALANSAKVANLVRPLRFEAMDETIAGLERHWHEMGLVDSK